VSACTYHLAEEKTHPPTPPSAPEKLSTSRYYCRLLASTPRNHVSSPRLSEMKVMHYFSHLFLI